MTPAAILGSILLLSGFLAFARSGAAMVEHRNPVRCFSYGVGAVALIVVGSSLILAAAIGVLG